MASSSSSGNAKSASASSRSRHQPIADPSSGSGYRALHPTTQPAESLDRQRQPDPRRERRGRRAMFVPPIKRTIDEDNDVLLNDRRRPLLEGQSEQQQQQQQQQQVDSINAKDGIHASPILPALISIQRTSSDPLQEEVSDNSLTTGHGGNNARDQLSDKSAHAQQQRRHVLRRQQSRDRWKKLSQHVLSGEALVSRRPYDNDDADDNTAAGMDSKSLSAQYSLWLVNANMFSIKECVLGIFVWIFIAVIAFKLVFGGHNWSVIDCIYFSVVTFTTVGYGDLVPETPAAKFFTMLYAASGVAWLSVVIGVLGSNILEAQELAIDRTNRKLKKEALNLFPPQPAISISKSMSFDSFGAAMSFESFVGVKPSCMSDVTQEDEDDWFLKSLLKFLRIKPTTSAANITMGAGLIILVLCLFGITISFDPALRAMPHVDVPYFVAVSAVTCGYGDVVPSSQWGRLATSLFIPLIVAATAQWMRFIAKHIIDKRSKKFRRAMASRELSYEDLEMMDDNDDGNVTRAEFLEFMLLAMGKVDKQLIAELREHFERIDTDNNGFLCKSELIDSARLKLKQPKQKLELTRYKAQLLKVAARAKEEARQLQMGLQHDCSVFSFLESEEEEDEKLKDDVV